LPAGLAGNAAPANPLLPAGDADDATPANPLDAVAAEGAAAAPAGEWHVNTAAGQQGPLALADVKLLIRSGELTELDHVFGPGQDDWIGAGTRDERKRYFAIKAKAQLKAATAAGGVGAGAAMTSAESAELNVDDPFAWCARHQQTEAAWICHGCNLSWCAACPGEKQLPGGALRTCPQCQRPVKERERAKPITLWWKEMSQVWAFPVRGLAWTAILTLSLLSVSQRIGGLITYVLVTAAMLSYYMLVIRKVGEGGRRMPDLGSVERYLDELFIPGVKAFVVTLLALLPTNLYVNAVAMPAMIEYVGAAAAAELAADQDEQAEDEWTAGGSEEALAAPKYSEQQEALIAAMEQMGVPQEEIDAVIAEFDDAARENGPQGWEEPTFTNSPWAPEPVEPPDFATVFVKLLGVAALALFSLVIWPLLMIIVAMFNTIAPVFNPPLILRIAKEAWPEYRRLLLFLVPILIVTYPFSVLATANIGELMILSWLGVPAVLGFIAVPIYYYLVLVILYVIGRTAELIDRKIDWF
jgi:hypothetical protein